jgi:hypothetical protein
MCLVQLAKANSRVGIRLASLGDATAVRRGLAKAD